MTKRVDKWVQDLIAMPHIEWERIDDVLQLVNTGEVALVSFDRKLRTIEHTCYMPLTWSLYETHAAIYRLRDWASTQRKLLKGTS